MPRNSNGNVAAKKYRFWTQFKHRGVKLECGDCPYIATTKAYLTKHRNEKHLGLRVACEVEGCSFQAASRQSLRHHRVSS